MSFAMFSIAIPSGEPELAQLNQFLAQHRVVHLEKRLVERDGVPYWVFLVEYASGSAPVSAAGSRGLAAGRGVPEKLPDYRERFQEPAELKLFYRLKDERKRLAAAAGVDLFVVFSNEQLAQMVERKVVTLEAMGQIDQVGEARLKRYGSAMLAVLQAHIRDGKVQPEPTSEPAPKAAETVVAVPSQPELPELEEDAR